MFYLTVVNKYYVTVTLGWHDSSAIIIEGKMTNFDSVKYMESHSVVISYLQMSEADTMYVLHFI